MAMPRTVSATRENGKTLVLLLLGAMLIPNARPILAQQASQKNGSSCRALRSMAKVHIAFGDYSRAQPLVEQALTLARTNDLGDAELSLCLIDAAWLYKNQWQLQKAEEMCLAGLKLQEKVHGKEHPYVAYTLRILSSIYRGQSKYPRAVSILSRAMTIMQNHPLPGKADLAAFRVDFAALMEATGDFAQAQACYSQALPVILKNCGPDHLYTAQVRQKAARLYAMQGKYDQAQHLINLALTIQEEVYGPDDDYLAPTWLIMARIHQARQDFNQAEKWLEKTLSVLKKGRGPDHQPAGTTLTTLGELLLAQGRQAEAEKILLRAINALKSSVGPNSDSTAMALNNLANLYVMQGKYLQAQELCRKALKVLEPILDKNHPNIAKVRDTMDRARRKSEAVTKVAGLEKP